MRKKIIALSLLLSFVAVSGFGCKGGSQQAQELMKQTNLTFWGVWDSDDDIKPLIAAYNKIHPNISIKYRKFSYDEYEQALVDALAEDRGPDIVSLNANWLRRYVTKLSVMPTDITMAYPVEKGTLKKEVIPEVRTKKSISMSYIKSSFLDTVYKDVVLTVTDAKTGTKTQKVYGLPFYIDNMAMFYNKDLLNNANIGELSPYWNQQFQKDVRKLTKQNSQGEILQAGISFGGGNNVDHASDLVALLVTQNGGEMIDQNGNAAFTGVVQGRDVIPGTAAVSFYSDFGNPTKEVYSWNSKLDNSFKMFLDGRLAITFGYSYQIPIIKAQAPKLNLGVQAMPQIENSSNIRNIADYWVQGVFKKSKHINEAWDFIQFASTDKTAVKSYLDKTGRLTALRSLVDEQKTDDNRGVFASQLLNSYTWYRGWDYKSADQSLKDMIDNIEKNPSTLDYEAKVAESKIQQTLNKTSSSN